MNIRCFDSIYFDTKSFLKNEEIVFDLILGCVWDNYYMYGLLYCHYCIISSYRIAMLYCILLVWFHYNIKQQEQSNKVLRRIKLYPKINRQREEKKFYRKDCRHFFRKGINWINWRCLTNTIINKHLASNIISCIDPNCKCSRVCIVRW